MGSTEGDGTLPPEVINVVVLVSIPAIGCVFLLALCKLAPTWSHQKATALYYCCIPWCAAWWSCCCSCCLFWCLLCYQGRRRERVDPKKPLMFGPLILIVSQDLSDDDDDDDDEPTSFPTGFVHPLALHISADLSSSNASSDSEGSVDSDEEACRNETYLIHSLSIRRSQALDTLFRARALEAAEAAAAQAEEDWNILHV